MNAMDVLWFVRVGTVIFLPADLYTDDDELARAVVDCVRMSGLVVRTVSSPLFLESIACREEFSSGRELHI